MKKTLFKLIQLLSRNKILWQKKSGVYLTFDDGPVKQNTVALLDILKRHGALATFFIYGKNAQAHPEIIERIRSDGHTVANHTYAHNRYEGNVKKFMADVLDCEKYIETYQQQKFLRPPFGEVSLKLIMYLALSEYVTVLWNKDTNDYALDCPEDVLNHVDIDNLEDGDIILMHDFPAVTPAILERILVNNSDKMFLAL